MVRIAWVTAILLGVLAILVGWLSGTPGGGSDRTQGASAGFAFEGQKNAEEAQAGAPPDNPRRRTEHVSAKSPSSSGGRSGSVSQPADTGAPTPVSRPQQDPDPQPAPQPRPAPAPRPQPTPPPPQIPAQPAPATPIQPPVTVANNNDGP